MSNRLYREIKIQGFEKDRKEIFAKVNIGASGAPSVVAIDSKGVSSVTRVSAGLYDVVMGTPASVQAASVDRYKKLLSVISTFNTQGASGAAAAAPFVSVVSDTVSTAGKVRLQFRNAAGTATDPAQNEVVLLQFVFGDSNI